MNRLAPTLALLVAAHAAVAQPAPPEPTGPAAAKPASVTVDGVPPVSAATRAAALPYMEFRQASAVAWEPGTRALLVATRFGNTNQIHRVAAPGAARQQLTFEDEPVTRGAVAPVAGAPVVLGKDIGGNEFFQLWRWDQGRLTLLTDGKSRNTGPVYTKDGTRVVYTSTRRTGADTDVWIVDPRDRASDRLLAERQGGGWGVADTARDGRTALIQRYISANQSEVHESTCNRARSGGSRPIMAPPGWPTAAQPMAPTARSGRRATSAPSSSGLDGWLATAASRRSRASRAGTWKSSRSRTTAARSPT